MSTCSQASERPVWTRILGLVSRLTEYQSITDQHKLIVETVAQELGAQADLWLTQALWHLPAAENTHLFPPTPPTELMIRAAKARQSVSETLADAGGRQTIAIPLLIRNRLLGVLQVSRHDASGTGFGSDELQVLDCAADHFAVILHSTHQLAIERWRGEQLALVRQVSMQIANVLDLNQLVIHIVESIQKTFKYYHVSLFVLESDPTVLHLKASAGPMPPCIQETRSVPLNVVRIGEGIIGSVGQSGTEIVAHDICSEPRYRHVESLPDTRSEVALPLKVEDRILGVLDVQSDRPGDLHDIDLLILRTLAENISVAIDHAQLVQRLQRRADEASVIARVNQAAATILDENMLLDQVVSLIHQQLDCAFVHVLIIDPVQGQIVYRAGSGHTRLLAQKNVFALALDSDQDIIAWVAAHGETVLENETRSDPRFRPSPIRPDEIQSELALPLAFSGQVLGVLDVQSERQDAFDMDSYFMFRALADSVATALRNASLYRSERWRRQVADSMTEVAGLLSSDLVLEQVLDAILVELNRTLPCDLAAICLLEDEELALAAVRSGRSTPLLTAFSSDDSLWIAQALSADQPLIRPGGAATDPIALDVGFPTNYSAIAAPLHAGGQHLGLLYLAHETPGRYGSEAQVIMSAFANYAAVAIENARVYQASQEQGLISAVMLQVAEATQSLSTLDQVLETIVRLAPLLVGIDRCAILLWDESDLTFLPTASYGLSPAQQALFEGWQPALKELWVLEELSISKTPQIVHDAATDTRTAQTTVVSLGFGSLLALPLLAQGEILGTMLVDYRDDLFSYDMTETVRDERLTLIQGIAHQAAAVIENSILREAQQQEAYVSAALLQVAQTVANLSDLDDTLSAIVRITPILVGVERCILFLWDERTRHFRVSHTYGLSREAEAAMQEQRYAPTDFGLLDTIRNQNHLFTYEAGTRSDNLPDGRELLPPDFAALMGYLPEGSGPLLGLPLSVQGDVLGVMILQEIDAPHQAHHRRIEIITGIAQQAALALQNEQLQQERLGRGRLERELQLAREIQQTFIPDLLPEPPGWELAAIWRAARQMAGDFYDLIELPGGQLGVLIADVADKGMPAALFMVLTRTWLRAVAQETPSPAAVLAQVNDHLVPDAKRGMFVTAFYAVLTPESGELVYANAGHNPPVIQRGSSREIELLETGGIALGVVAGARSDDHTCHLEPGDRAVFYTDGVTEAMSPEGNLYGMEQLERIVQRTAAGDAQHLLQAIDRSVAAHASTAPASDDLTLIVLQRLLRG